MINTKNLYYVIKNKHGRINAMIKNNNGLLNFIHDSKIIEKKIALVLDRHTKDMPKGFFYRCLINSDIFIVPSENLVKI